LGGEDSAASRFIGSTLAGGEDQVVAVPGEFTRQLDADPAESAGDKATG
jgi:hypothetical protein